jgi:hypothetical protein
MSILDENRIKAELIAEQLVLLHGKDQALEIAESLLKTFNENIMEEPNSIFPWKAKFQLYTEVRSILNQPTK